MSDEKTEDIVTQYIRQFTVTVNLWGISLLLVVVGIIISGYLSYSKITDTETVCVDGSSCDVVQSSIYSELIGIPIVYLGLLTYVFIGAWLLFEPRIEFLRENGVTLLFAFVLFTFVYSMYLVYLQGVVLDAWCQWCLAHEATMTALFVVTVLRLKRVLIIIRE